MLHGYTLKSATSDYDQRHDSRDRVSTNQRSSSYRSC